MIYKHLSMVGLIQTPTKDLPYTYHKTYHYCYLYTNLIYGRCMVGVSATPTMPQSLYTSMFQARDGRWLGVFIFSTQIWKRHKSTYKNLRKLVFFVIFAPK